MKVAIVLCGLLCYVNAAAYVAIPRFDTAVVHSSRLGGNFAYSTVESKAYAPIAAYQVPAVSAPYIVAASPIIPPSPVVANYPAAFIPNYPTTVVSDYPAESIAAVAPAGPPSEQLSSDDSVVVEAA